MNTSADEFPAVPLAAAQSAAPDDAEFEAAVDAGDGLVLLDADAICQPRSQRNLRHVQSRRKRHDHFETRWRRSAKESKLRLATFRVAIWRSRVVRTT